MKVEKKLIKIQTFKKKISRLPFFIYTLSQLVKRRRYKQLVRVRISIFQFWCSRLDRKGKITKVGVGVPKHFLRKNHLFQFYNNLYGKVVITSNIII